ncbi:MAG: hypothetical protein GXP63_06755 [DPANN group archaeon]|nr:hypothetical protein [DPANN group archaeon]
MDEKKKTAHAKETKGSSADRKTAGQKGQHHSHHDTDTGRGHGAGQRPHRRQESQNLLSKPLLGLMIAAVFLLSLNQLQIASVSSMIGSAAETGGRTVGSGGTADLSGVDINAIRSTGETVASVFPVEDIVTSDDAIAIMFPSGTPEYGADLGVSFDDPVASLAVLAKMYPGLKQEVQSKDPAAWQRYMNLASKPVGISCEYCCGLKAVGIDKNGNSACGCQHNPALLSVALYLTAYSDYSDAEILREVMQWKTLFFPKNMIELGMTVAGGDTSRLTDLPGMVGGC